MQNVTKILEIPKVILWRKKKYKEGKDKNE